MSITLYFILGIVWVVSGMIGPIYDWTKRWDITIEELPVFLLLGIIAPAGWVIGILSLWESKSKTILIKKRNKN